MVDIELVMTHLKEIEDNLKLLKEFRVFSLNELKNKKIRWMVEHGLMITIQNVIDVSMHILASMAINKIDTYKEAMLYLGKKGIVPENLAKRFAKMAGLRNIIVHEYLKIDLKKVWNVLRRNLVDFKKFCEYIYKYIER